MTKRNISKHWSAAGSPEGCVRNIVTHLDVLLTDHQKASINWHDEQSVDLAVMRLIAAWQDAGAPDYVPGQASPVVLSCTCGSSAACQLHHFQHSQTICAASEEGT